ncbi:peroxiredoxin [Halosimplex rubrum]|uniref:thioredoxin-dependent peroxiredoxin n=1 Tax=Halosimplex rubrum TaxID=869889 RepID=A0A7D5TMN7_9EURY|nr:peroxiredoxin [Halosimplex rubrum]QLH76674.1 peroxiredoxin [Halosimplex rubrum]
MALEPGDPAPEVAAPNQDGETVEPDWAGVSVVYFYPKDDTPGCTTEAEQFQTELESYRDAGVTVYGVSVDGVDSHAAFADEYGIEFDLLADPDGEVVDAFDVERSRGVASRTTFVVVDGSVQATYTGVDPEGHARNVLADLVETGVVSIED